MTFNHALPPVLVVGEIGLVRSLGQIGCPVYVGSYYRDNVGLYSRYCVRRVHFSHSSSDAFADELIAFAKKQNRKMVFFSDDDRAVLTFSRHRARLAEYFYFNLPDNETVEDVLDKARFASMARRLALPVPKSFAPSNCVELAAAADEISYPCILKPTSKDLWWHPDFLRIVGPYRKAVQCDSRQELLDSYAKVVQVNKNVVLQEFIAGDDANLYSVNMYFDRNQNPLAYFIGHKIRIYPVHAGVATLVETTDDEQMRDLAIEVAKKLKIVGHFNIQFKKDSVTGAMKVMEIHTRNSLWCYLATGAGLNISAIAYFDMIGREYPFESNYQIGVKWLDLGKDLKAYRGYRRLGEIAPRTWLQSLHGKVVHHILSMRDPGPSVADAVFILKRRLFHAIASGAAPPL